MPLRFFLFCLSSPQGPPMLKCLHHSLYKFLSQILAVWRCVSRIHQSSHGPLAITSRVCHCIVPVCQRGLGEDTTLGAPFWPQRVMLIILVNLPGWLPGGGYHPIVSTGGVVERFPGAYNRLLMVVGHFLTSSSIPPAPGRRIRLYLLFRFSSLPAT